MSFNEKAPFYFDPDLYLLLFVAIILFNKDSVDQI